MHEGDNCSLISVWADQHEQTLAKVEKLKQPARAIRPVAIPTMTHQL